MKKRILIGILLMAEVLLLIIGGIGIALGVQQLVAYNIFNKYRLIVFPLLEVFGIFQMLVIVPKLLKYLKDEGRNKK